MNEKEMQKLDNQIQIEASENKRPFLHLFVGMCDFAKQSHNFNSSFVERVMLKHAKDPIAGIISFFQLYGFSYDSKINQDIEVIISHLYNRKVLYVKSLNRRNHGNHKLTKTELNFLLNMNIIAPRGKSNKTCYVNRASINRLIRVIVKSVNAKI